MRQKIKSFFLNNKHLFLLLYAAVYIPWFIHVEKTVDASSSFHVIHMGIDDHIPFCEYFVIPYYLWFVYMILSIGYIAFNDGRSCWKMGAFLITGMTLFLIISTVYPNGHMLRPETFPRENFCTDLVRKLYASDTPTNLFPSIHVYNSLGCYFALTHCECMMSQKKWRWVKPAAAVLTALIIAATVCLKQHSVFDVLTAFLLSAVMYGLCYGRLSLRIEAKILRWKERRHHSLQYH